jgi:hypothetical protein
MKITGSGEELGEWESPMTMSRVKEMRNINTKKYG